MSLQINQILTFGSSNGRGQFLITFQWLPYGIVDFVARGFTAAWSQSLAHISSCQGLCVLQS